MHSPSSRIPVSGPWITQHEINYVTEAVTSAWYENANTFIDRFEKAFADYLDRKYAISLPSCTSGIHLALLGLNVGPGDEVIVPDCTWIASAAPVTYVGATPVFADMDPQTWCLDPRSVESCVTERTKAIIPVNLYGGMPDMDSLLSLAQRLKISVIEDAAESIGSEYRGRRAGSFGEASVFSFHGSKTLTTGEGGLLATNSQELRDRILFLRDHGRMPGDRLFQNTAVGYKYKMSALQAALGLAQLERVQELIVRKREIFNWYREELSGVRGISLNAEPEGTLNSYWMCTVIFDSSWGLKKEQVLEFLWKSGIDARPFFNPLSSLEAYRKQPEALVAQKRNRISYDISPRGVNLPSALNLQRDQVARVCQALKTLLSSRSTQS